MLKYSLTILIILLGLSQFSLTNRSSKPRKIPPGTEFVKHLGYYVDKKVVSIIDWREFYWYTKHNFGDSSALFCLPDTNAIKVYYGRNIYYSENETDKKLPIVGVTPDQIEKYSEFRTEAVRQLKGFIGSNITYYPLDSTTYTYLKIADKRKNIINISSKVPEIIYYNKVQNISTNNEIQPYKSNSNPVFGFRCIAKFN
jgi:hypothetical protein